MEWAYWKKRFERYHTATKLDKEEGCVQVSTLIYALGPEAENIFSLFTFARGEDTDHDAVLERFNTYFISKRNVIHERACLYQRAQRPGERAETFIRTLYELSEHCDFGAQREEHIRDRIVVGILDKELSRKLQLIPNLTLEMTVQEVRQVEDVEAQVNMQGESVRSVQEVLRGRQEQRGRRREDGGSRGGARGKQCGRCGKPPHGKDEKCPAMKTTCHKYKKTGHWGKCVEPKW